MADNHVKTLPIPPTEITQRIPQYNCPQAQALRARRDEWIATAAGQGFSANRIAAVLSLPPHTVTGIISRWRCKHGGLPGAAPAPTPEPAPEAHQPDPDKHLVELPAGRTITHTTAIISRPRAPWEGQHSNLSPERPESAPRALPIRAEATPAHRIDINTFIATLRAEVASYKEAHRG